MPCRCAIAAARARGRGAAAGNPRARGGGGRVAARRCHERANADGGQRRRAPRSGVADQADDGLPRLRRTARQDDRAVADGERLRTRMARRRVADVHRAAPRRLGRRAAARNDRAIGQRRVGRAGRARRRQRGSVRRANECRSRAACHAEHPFHQRDRAVRPAALFDGRRHGEARGRGDPRLSRVLPALFAEGIPLQQHHAAQPQSPAVDRSLRGRDEDRPHRRGRLVSRRVGVARGPPRAGGRARRELGRRARVRSAKAAELGLPGLRHRAALPVGQAGDHVARVERRRAGSACGIPRRSLSDVAEGQGRQADADDAGARSRWSRRSRAPSAWGRSRLRWRASRSPSFR